jgi:cysteine desulfurase
MRQIALAGKDERSEFIVSSIEHPCVLNSAKYMQSLGFKVIYLPVDKYGKVDMNVLKNTLSEKTLLVSVMAANNEIGVIQNIKEISALAKSAGAWMHTDAVQALGKIPVNVDDMGADYLTLSAHKIYGPKGIGALYIKQGVTVANLLHGGGQESRKRPGTENVTGIIGFGKAAEIAKDNLDAQIVRITGLREYFIDKVMSEIDDVHLNGHRQLRHPGNANLRFDYIEGESILVLLDMKGISVSTGSACASGELAPSHVLAALNVPIELIHSSLRFTIGAFTTKEDLDYVINELKIIVKKLRGISSVSANKERLGI